MSTRKRSRPIGPGYMPKGGAPAARAHNEGWKAAVLPAEPAPVAASVAVATASVAVPPGRARQRAAWLHDTGVLARIGAASGVLSLFLQAFQK